MDETRSRYAQAVDGLDKSIHHLTWLGHHWGRRGTIALHNTKAWYEIHRLDTPSGPVLSALSSTYYSAATNAGARVSKAFFMKPLWLAIAAWCLFRALRLSNRMIKVCGGIGHLSTSELDVRQSILRRAGQFDAAEVCIQEALLRSDTPAHTKAFLLVAKGEINTAKRRLNPADTCYDEALKIVEAPGIEATTRVRVYRAAGLHFLNDKRVSFTSEETRKVGRNLLELALNLARKHGLLDQVEKIQALLD